MRTSPLLRDWGEVRGAVQGTDCPPVSPHEGPRAASPGRLSSRTAGRAICRVGEGLVRSFRGRSRARLAAHLKPRWLGRSGRPSRGWGRVRLAAKESAPPLRERSSNARAGRGRSGSEGARERRQSCIKVRLVLLNLIADKPGGIQTAPALEKLGLAKDIHTTAGHTAWNFSVS